MILSFQWQSNTLGGKVGSLKRTLEFYQLYTLYGRLDTCYKYMYIKAPIHQAMLLQAICGYFDLQATLLPRIETCSILGNTLLTTSK